VAHTLMIRSVIAAIKNSYKPLCKQESDNLWCRGKLLISIKRTLFFSRRKILKVDGRDPQNREKNAPAGRFTCMTKLVSTISLKLTRTSILLCIWNSCADEKRREIRMVKMNVIFNDIRLLICLTPLQVNWVSNHLNVCHKPTSLSPINCQSVDNCCIIINTLINHHDPIYL
jgi:hypothetical protein